MIVTLVRIIKPFTPYDGKVIKHIPIGEVGFIIDRFGRLGGSLMSIPNEEVAIETFTKEGKNGATYYHIPNDCYEECLDLDWHEAFKEYYKAKHPFFTIEAELVVDADRINLGVWMIHGKNRHRQLPTPGTDEEKDPNKTVNYWESVTNRFGATPLLIDPFVQALCRDFQNNDPKLSEYYRLQVKRFRERMRANEGTQQ